MASPGAGELGHERRLRLEALGRYDRYLARAPSDAEQQALWRELRRRDLEEIGRLERLLAAETGAAPARTGTVSGR